MGMVELLSHPIYLKSLSDGLFLYCLVYFEQSHKCTNHEDIPEYEYYYNYFSAATTNGDSIQTEW